MSRKKSPLFKFLPLPPDFDPIDATVLEVAAWRRESEWTVHEKVRTGVYESYKDRRIRKIVFASVKRDRERALAEGTALVMRAGVARARGAEALRRTSQNPRPPSDAAPTGKRLVGRPRRTRPEAPLASDKRVLEDVRG